MLYTFLTILIISWTLNPFLKKILLKKINSYEFMILSNLTIFIATLFYFLYLVLIDKEKIDFNSYKNLEKRDLCVLMLTTITSLSATLILLHLIKMKDISYILPHTQSLIMVLTLIIGYLFFSENVNMDMAFGVLLILFGITIINFSS